MMKIVYKLMLLLPVFMVVGTVSLLSDPGNLFRSDAVVRVLADHLAKGHNVWGFNTNVNERLLLKFLFEQSNEPKDVLVFGSSRSKAINEALFPDRSFFNAAVSAGTLEDFMGIYQMLHEKKLLPKELIVEVSAWMLNPKNPLLHNDARTLTPEYERAREHMGLPPLKDSLKVRKSERAADGDILLRVKELFSPAYYQQSVIWAIKGWESGLGLTSFNIRTTDRPIDGEFVLHRDGSWTSSEENKIYTVAEAIRDAKVPKGIDNFYEIPDSRKREFESFIRQAQADGIKLTFYFPPWPPESYSRIVANPEFRVVKEEEEYLRTVARKCNIKTIGDFNGGGLGLGIDDFSDNEHLRRRVVVKILSPIFAKTP